ncbi:hypothetical protein KF728_17465 [Candidatus Obscuribacterales bacterium]|nr:hypothetical protein [Candidatus Obscuribacterales bacterium]
MPKANAKVRISSLAISVFIFFIGSVNAEPPVTMDSVPGKAAAITLDDWPRSLDFLAGQWIYQSANRKIEINWLKVSGKLECVYHKWEKDILVRNDRITAHQVKSSYATKLFDLSAAKHSERAGSFNSDGDKATFDFSPVLTVSFEKSLKKNELKLSVKEGSVTKDYVLSRSPEEESGL